LDTDDVVRRFRVERQILASLSHPNIAALLDGGSTPDGRPYLVMELVSGEPLDAYCERRGLPVEVRVRLMITVGRAVQHAHTRLVVHRDLKPSNILVTSEGVVKLLDFGIAKLLDEPLAGAPGAGRGGTRTGLRLLTPEYASPELRTGQPVTTASDVYQLGLVLSRALDGPAVGDLGTIVAKALREEPERRYASASDFVEDLERYLDGLPVRARPDSASYRLRKFASRHRAGLAATTLLVLVLVGSAAVLAFQAG
jgi:hypothetical protein